MAKTIKKHLGISGDLGSADLSLLGIFVRAFVKDERWELLIEREKFTRVESVWSFFIIIFFHSKVFACFVEVDLGLIHVFDCLFYFFFLSAATIGTRSPTWNILETSKNSATSGYWVFALPSHHMHIWYTVHFYIFFYEFRHAPVAIVHCRCNITASRYLC